MPHLFDHLVGTAKREPLWTGPVEWDVFARIRRPLELVAERIDGTDRRFAPSHELSGSGLGARRVHELRIFSRQARRAAQGRGPGLHFAGDLRSPLGAVGRDLEGDLRPLHATQLPAFGEQRSDESRKSSDLAAENAGKHVRLALVGAVVNENAGRPLSLPRPEIAFPSSHPDEAQTVEIDIAVMAMSDVPEQHRLAEAVVRRLGEGAGAGDGAAAIVEPVSGDVPAGNLGDEDLRSPMNDNRTLSAVTPPACEQHAGCCGAMGLPNGPASRTSNVANCLRSNETREAFMAWQLSGQLIEACSCKSACPCVLGPAEPDQGWCSGALTFSIEKGQAEKASRVIRELAENKEICLRMGRRARILFDQRFDTRHAIQAWEAVISATANPIVSV